MEHAHHAIDEINEADINYTVAVAMEVIKHARYEVHFIDRIYTVLAVILDFHRRPRI